MMRLSELVRRGRVVPGLRKKLSGVNMQKRKEIRSLSKLNIYSRQFTGQQNEHGWFTPKRFRAMGIFLQATRNTHPGTLPIKPQLKKEIVEKFVEDSHWEYYVFRNYLSQIKVQEKKQKQALTEQELNMLPASFRDQFKKTEVPEPLPKLARPNFIYNAQQNIFLPQDQRYRINLIFKLQNPPEKKGEQDQPEKPEKEE